MDAAMMQSAKIFDKDELAAILRFGAEKLFKDDHGDKEDSKASPEPEEDIDDILARAEKVESNAASQPGGATDLLNQFNYATFKNEEDDATFWNRPHPQGGAHVSGLPAQPREFQSPWGCIRGVPDGCAALASAAGWSRRRRRSSCPGRQGSGQAPPVTPTMSGTPGTPGLQRRGAEDHRAQR